MTISRRLLTVAAATALALSFAACNGDGDGAATETTVTTAAVTTSSTPELPDTPGVLTATLSGAEEVPGPGVEDGTGTAEVRLVDGEICYELNVTMGETPTAAHIHEGAAGTAGGVVVDLEPEFTEGESAFEADACVPVEESVAQPIFANPSGFYVNIHTAEHPDGAVRGQLSATG